MEEAMLDGLEGTHPELLLAAESTSDHEQQQLTRLRPWAGSRFHERRVAVVALAVLGVGLIAWHPGQRSSANLDRVVRAAEASRGYCGTLMDDTEYHTRESIYWVSNILSPALCCDECEAHPECGAWVYGKAGAVHGQAQHCYLKKLAKGEKPREITRDGFVSGVVHHGLHKHGVVAELLHEASVDEPTIMDNETCPGKLNLTGHGPLSIIAASWRTPGHRASRVELPPKSWAVVPHLNSRAYFGKTCSVAETSAYDRSEYADMRLLGKVLRYTVDMSNVGCGCNVQLHLVPMSRNSQPSKCDDFFCGHGWQPCGVSCAEVGVQDANRYAWSTNLHVHDDDQGPKYGYGGGLDWVGRRNWNESQYGPGGDCVDTSWPFDVAASFPVDSIGVLNRVEVTLSQVGKHCVLKVKLDNYNYKGRDGMAELSRVLQSGVTPVLSYWSSTSLEWLDGAGLDGRGPCVKETPMACPASVRFYNFAVEQRPEPVSPLSTIQAAIDQLHEHVRQSIHDTKMTEVEELDGGKLNLTDAVRDEAFSEENDDNCEWEVVLSNVYVRSKASYTGKMLTTKLKGEVVHGKRQGGWVKLAYEDGYMAVNAADGKQLLEKRTVNYKKIVKGTCSDAAMFPIEDEVGCLAAGVALGYFDQELSVRWRGERKAPDGCYLLDGQIYLSSSQANVGNGVVGDMLPICSSQAYPTTTTTTSTRTTSTTSTSTTTKTSTSTATTTTSTTITTTSTTTWGFPSFFCVEVVRVHGYELPLVKNQQVKRVSIFACEEYIVFSDGGVEQTIGTAPDGKEIKTVVIPPIKEAIGDLNNGATTNSWLNTETFLQVWDLCKRDGRYRKHDWTVKVDPDAVFFPDRLRKRMRPHTVQGSKLFVMNCARYSPVALYGSVEIFSKGALDAYLAGQQRCRHELPWHGWGEDFFMSHCMDLLQVGRIYDFELLSDKRCIYHPCWDQSRVVFHDYKDSSLDGSWFKCWRQSHR